MAKVIVSKSKLDNIADAVANVSGAQTPLTLDDVVTEVCGLTKVEGTITINVNGSIDVTQYAEADVSVPTPTPSLQDKTVAITPTTSAQTQTVAADSGYDGLDEVTINTAAVPTGSATPPTTISGSQATLTTGTNTITLQKTLSVTPQVSAGYVSAGTAGNVLVNLNANVTTKAAANITPGTSNQTIASGTYLTGTQTISGDANLVAGNIKSGTTIFGVTGTYSGGGGGGASNVVKGTFKSSLNGYSISVSTGYSGNGYPISIAIFPSEGSYKTGSPAYSAVRRYGLVSWTAVKCDLLARPNYLTTSVENNMSVSVIYKSSSSNANQYSGTMQMSGTVLSNSSASRTYYLCAKYNDSNKLSVYIGGTSHGFIPDIEYTYIIVFSE